MRMKYSNFKRFLRRHRPTCAIPSPSRGGKVTPWRSSSKVFMGYFSGSPSVDLRGAGMHDVIIKIIKNAFHCPVFARVGGFAPPPPRRIARSKHGAGALLVNCALVWRLFSPLEVQAPPLHLMRVLLQPAAAGEGSSPWVLRVGAYGRDGGGAHGYQGENLF